MPVTKAHEVYFFTHSNSAVLLHQSFLIGANAHGKADMDIGQLYNSKASARASSCRITTMGAIGCNRDLESHILRRMVLAVGYLAMIFQAQFVGSITQFQF